MEDKTAIRIERKKETLFMRYSPISIETRKKKDIETKNKKKEHKNENRYDILTVMHIVYAVLLNMLLLLLKLVWRLLADSFYKYSGNYLLRIWNKKKCSHALVPSLARNCTLRLSQWDERWAVHGILNSIFGRWTIPYWACGIDNRLSGSIYDVHFHH